MTANVNEKFNGLFYYIMILYALILKSYGNILPLFL